MMGQVQTAFSAPLMQTQSYSKVFSPRYFTLYTGGLL